MNIINQAITPSAWQPVALNTRCYAFTVESRNGTPVKMAMSHGGHYVTVATRYTSPMLDNYHAKAGITIYLQSKLVNDTAEIVEYIKDN